MMERFSPSTGTVPSFGKMRGEMREVLLMKQKAPYSPSRFEILKGPGMTEGRCWLRNMYFRGDATFYAELNQKLQKARKNELRWTGTKKQRKRATDLFLQTHPRAKNAWDWGRDRSRPLRKVLKVWFGWNLTEAV